MGSPKALLSWDGGTILEHLIHTWKQAGAAQIAVVFDPSNHAVVAELDRLAIRDRIANPNAAGGMMTSLRAASAWSAWQPTLTHIAVALVDQPQIPLAVLVDLAAFTAGHPGHLCQPASSQRRGHPVFFPRHDFDQIAATQAPDLRAFIHQRQERRAFLPCEDPNVFLDLDTPDDYLKARGAG